VSRRPTGRGRCWSCGKRRAPLAWRDCPRCHASRHPPEPPRPQVAEILSSYTIAGVAMLVVLPVLHGIHLLPDGLQPTGREQPVVCVHCGRAIAWGSPCYATSRGASCAPPCDEDLVELLAAGARG
jgi:hypothetical protein